MEPAYIVRPGVLGGLLSGWLLGPASLGLVLEPGDELARWAWFAAVAVSLLATAALLSGWLVPRRKGARVSSSDGGTSPVGSSGSDCCRS